MKTPSTTDQILPLHELQDLETPADFMDVRDWQVISHDGHGIGEVEDVLVDTAAMRVRYVDIRLKQRGLAALAGKERRALIPVGAIRSDRANERLVVQLSSDQVSQLPAYEGGAVTRQHETALRRVFDPSWTEDAEPDFYANDLYEDTDRGTAPRPATQDAARLTLSEEEVAVGRREVPAGAVDVKKRIETEQVREAVPVRHEEVTIERRPLAPGDQAEASIAEGEIHVPLTKEEAVVQKRTVPKEEVVIRKETVQGTETVETDVKRERADVSAREGVKIKNDSTKRGR